MKLLVLFSFFLTSVTGFAHPCCCEDVCHPEAEVAVDSCHEAAEASPRAVVGEGENRSESSESTCVKTCCAVVAVGSNYAFAFPTRGVPYISAGGTAPSYLPPDLSSPPPRA